MRSFAGTVCGLITIMIYGIAIICGILYHSAYVEAWKSQGLEVNYTSEYYIRWIAFFCIAAIISAIHHALWSIIDNQSELYAKLEKQNDMLEEMKKMQEKQMPDLQQTNSSRMPWQSDEQANISNYNQDTLIDSKEGK